MKFVNLYILFFFFFVNAYSQKSNSTPQIYELDTNKFDLNGISDLLEGSTVCFMGELEYYENNELIHFKTFEYLHDNYGYKTFVLYFSNTSTRLLNKYLASGNESFLDSVLSYYEINDNYRMLFRNIHQLYKRDNDIKILGIDVFGDRISFQELKRILIEKDCKVTARELMDPLDFNYLSDQDCKVLYKKLTSDFNLKRNEYESQLSSKAYVEYKRILEELNFSIEYDNKTPSPEAIKYVYTTLSNLLSSGGNEKYYIDILWEQAPIKSNIKWGKLNPWTSLAANIIEKHKEIKIISGLIYYINVSFDKQEEKANSFIIYSEDTRKKIKEKVNNIALFKTDSSRDVVNFVIVDNLHDK